MKESSSKCFKGQDVVLYIHELGVAEEYVMVVQDMYDVLKVFIWSEVRP